MEPAAGWSALPLPKRELTARDAAAFTAAEPEPETAAEYLFRVRAEAERLPQIMVAEPTAATARIEEAATSSEPIVSGGSIIPDEWASSVLADFADLRLRMAVCAARGVGAKREIPLPRFKDERSWRVFCLGTKVALVEDDGGGDDEDEGDDDEEEAAEDGDKDGNNPLPPVLPDKSGILAFDDRPVRVTEDGCEPSMALVLQFDGVLTQALLTMNVDWLDTATLITAQRALWLYALMARVEKPIHADVAATLRQLVRRALRLRDDAPDEAHRARAHLLLLLAGRYFQQALPGELPR